MALGHGLQDAQKTMGIVVMALVIADVEDYGDPIPVWVKIACALMLSLGTYAGGWRIMRTLGRKIIELDPPQGFAAETTGASIMFGSAFIFHAPISTTHVITSAIMGVGATKRVNAVRWGVAKNIVLGWFITMPARRPGGRGLFRTRASRRAVDPRAVDPRGTRAPYVEGPAPVEWGGGPFPASRRHRHAASRGVP